MIIRKMTENEVPQVAAMEIVTFHDPWSEDSLRKAAKDSLYYYAVSMEEEKVLGYAGMIFGWDEGQITNVAVSKDYRRQGIAAHLLRHLKEVAQEYGCGSLVLEVRESNAGAIALYEKEGFQNLGLRPRFYQHPEEGAYIMELRWK